MSNITPFSFEGTNIRTSMINEIVYFHAGDVCSILGLSNPSQAIERIDADDIISNEVIDNLGRVQIANFVNESGLYSLILGSKKSEAKKFKKWVTSEVLPSIRKTGSYGIPLQINSHVLFLMAEGMKKLEEEKAVETHRRFQNMGGKGGITKNRNFYRGKVEELEIRLDESKDYATIKKMGHGNWRKLKCTVAIEKYPAIDVFDANYGSVKSYHRNVWLEAYSMQI